MAAAKAGARKKRRRYTEERARNLLAMNPHLSPGQLAEKLGLTLPEYRRFVDKRRKEAWVWAEAQADGEFVAHAEAACVRLDFMLGRLLQYIDDECYTVIDKDGNEATVPIPPAGLASLAKSVADMQAIRLQLAGEGAFRALKRARARYLEQEASALRGPASEAAAAAAAEYAVQEVPAPPPPASPASSKSKRRRRPRKKEAAA